MPYKLSPNSLNLYKQCPRCFYLTLHKKWKRPSAAFPSLPSGMDKILKNHFDSFMKKGKMPPELCEKQSCKNLRLFDNENLLSVWRNNKKGISYTDKKGNTLHGAIDNLLVNTINSKLIVLDYKTRGFPLKEDTAEHYELQLDIYNFLLRKNKYETENYGFLLFYFPKEILPTGEFLFDTELVKMQVSALRGEKAWKNALRMLSRKCPKTTCEWCKGVKTETLKNTFSI